MRDLQKSLKEIEVDGYAEIKPSLNRLDQFILLFLRELKVFFRNPMKFGRAVGNSVITIIIIGLLFYQEISDDRPIADPQIVYPYG